MKNNATFIEDVAKITSEKLDSYEGEVWSLLGIYSYHYGAQIEAQTVREALERVQKLAEALENVLTDMEN